MSKTSGSQQTPDLIPAFSPDLCLEFANTRYWRGSGEPSDTIANPFDFLDWCKRQHVVGDDGAAVIRRWWEQRPLLAETIWREAIALREALYRLLFALADGRAFDPADLAEFNRALADAPARFDVVATKDGFAWLVPRAFPPRVSVILAPVLWSAGDLLVGPRRARLRHCANERCLWLFVDESKGGRRRWCSMAACGNRAKAQRHYLKHKSA
jgi:predicted RNA-binding Zn ribbon-like protein